MADGAEGGGGQRAGEKVQIPSEYTEYDFPTVSSFFEDPVPTHS